MRPKSLLLLALALGCGLVASIGISQVMDRNGHSQAKLETVPIYVALHNINLGDPIDAKMLSLQEWPKDKVPHGAISTLEELQGRRPRTAIIEGEPILEGKLLDKGQMADPIRSDHQGHAAVHDQGRRRKKRRRLARPWRPRRRAIVRSQGRPHWRRDGQVESHLAKHSRVRRRPDRSACGRRWRRAKRRQDHFAAAQARAGQQALAGRTNRRDQPYSSQPRR